ncbi:MAG: hypothetical protein Q9227_002158 [Pyrenula ochraceoflavens]
MYPFAAVIVNHSSPTTDTSPHGKLLCSGLASLPDPTSHGEVAALRNCTDLLAALYQDAGGIPWSDLTMYSTAEPCPMCAAATRWAGLKDVVYGVSIDYLVENGWAQIGIPAEKVYAESGRLNGGVATGLLGGVESEEIERRGLFGWQFGEGDCPDGCEKEAEKGGSCMPV